MTIYKFPDGAATEPAAPTLPEGEIPLTLRPFSSPRDAWIEDNLPHAERTNLEEMPPLERMREMERRTRRGLHDTEERNIRAADYLLRKGVDPVPEYLPSGWWIIPGLVFLLAFWIGLVFVLL